MIKLDDFDKETFDQNKLNDLGLMTNGEINENFENVYRLYSSFLNRYIANKLDLYTLDTYLRKSPVGLKEIELKDMDIYQSMSNLRYLYIRNTIKIDRLSNSDIELLLNRYKNENYSYDDEAWEIIDRTYGDLLPNRNYPNGTMINYGPDKCYGYSDGLIIGVRYNLDSTNKDNLQAMGISNADEYIINYINEFLVNDKMHNKISMPISIIKYDENSIKKISNNLESNYLKK